MLAARELAWFGAGSGSRARELGVIWMGGLELAGEGDFWRRRDLCWRFGVRRGS